MTERSAEQVGSGRVPPIEHFALIIGAMKSGTTSLYDYLVTHPQIAACKIKEPNFFGSQNWPLPRERYYQLWENYDPRVHRYALEASSFYTKRPRSREVGPRIAAFGGDFRYIYIVRHPVDRVESHIAHNIAKRRGTLENYQHLLRPAISTSRYGLQLDSFRASVGNPEVLVLDFDDLRREPLHLLARCVRFLGIDERFAFGPRAPSNVRRSINGSEEFRLSPDERLAIGRELYDDIQRFGSTYGIDVSAWNLPPPPAGTPSPPVVAEEADERLPGPAGGLGGRRGKRKAAAGARAGKVVGEHAAASLARPRPARRRIDRMSSQYVRALVERLAPGAKSLIDVGSGLEGFAEELDWIPHRVALDRRAAYSSPTVTGVVADFLTYQPDRHFDVGLCLQVLERLPDPSHMAQKLLATADHVVVAVPYLWPAGLQARHKQDPVDEAKLVNWFGRRPDYQIVVEEPLVTGPANRSLIAYYGNNGVPFDAVRSIGDNQPI